MSVHLTDDRGTVVGCSEATDMRDVLGKPVGQGICDHLDPLHPTVVDVPMPAYRDGFGWRILVDFTK